MQKDEKCKCISTWKEKPHLYCGIFFFGSFPFCCRALGSPFGSAKLDQSKILVEAEKDNFI